MFALLAAIFLMFEPVAAMNCTDACAQPAFDLRGYNFYDENKGDPRPVAALEGDRTLLHVAFTPPTTGFCEIFQVRLPEWVGQRLAVRPIKKIHPIHLEIAIPSSGVFVFAMDCWKPGHEENGKMFSRFYQADFDNVGTPQ